MWTFCDVKLVSRHRIDHGLEYDRAAHLVDHNDVGLLRGNKINNRLDRLLGGHLGEQLQNVRRSKKLQKMPVHKATQRRDQESAQSVPTSTVEWNAIGR